MLLERYSEVISGFAETNLAKAVPAERGTAWLLDDPATRAANNRDLKTLVPRVRLEFGNSTDGFQPKLLVRMPHQITVGVGCVSLAGSDNRGCGGSNRATLAA